jgi:hypothetical protein
MARFITAERKNAGGTGGASRVVFSKTRRPGGASPAPTRLDDRWRELSVVD